MYKQSDYRSKLFNVIGELEGKLIEREQVIRLVLLAIFSKHHVFLIGLPGVAKTRLLKIISGIVSNGSFWEILMTKETKEKHLLGEDIEEDGLEKVLKVFDHENIARFQKGANFSILKTILSFFKIGEKAYQSGLSLDEIKKQMSMLNHHFVLFDEMFKASDDLLVSCLPMLNERYYTSKGKAIPVPLNSLFSASNELPFGEKIEPFVDRILFWYEVERIQKKENFVKYIQGEFDASKETKIKFTLEEIEFCFLSANAIKILPHIEDLYSELEANIFNAGIKVSNRKFGPEYIIRALKTSAWLNGRDAIDVSDLLLVQHMAWQTKIERDNLKTVVHDTIFGNKAQVADFVNGILKDYKTADGKYKEFCQDAVAFNMEFMGRQGNIDYNNFLRDLDEILQILIELKDKMCEVYDLYQYNLEVSDLINKNIFLTPFYINTFEFKIKTEDNKEENSASEAQSVITLIESFILERTNDIELLKKWRTSNATMSYYQSNRNNIRLH